MQDSQVNVVRLVQKDLEEGRDIVFLVRKETKVILAIQDSMVGKDCSDATLLRRHHKIDWKYSMQLLPTKNSSKNMSASHVQAIQAHLDPQVPQVKDQKEIKVNRVQWEAQA